MAGPLALFLLFLTGVGPLIAWRRATAASLRKQFTKPALFGIVTGAVLTAVFWGSVSVWTLACWALSAFTVGTITQEYCHSFKRPSSYSSTPRGP